MALYEVIYEGTVRETYLVEAESEDEALENWSNDEPTSSEVIDGAPTEVILVEED